MTTKSECPIIYTCKRPGIRSHVDNLSPHTRLSHHRTSDPEIYVKLYYDMNRSRTVVLETERHRTRPQVLTFASLACIPGASMMQATIVPTSSISAYIMRVVVEFLDDGHIAQQNEHAVLPKQQAI